MDLVYLFYSLQVGCRHYYLSSLLYRLLGKRILLSLMDNRVKMSIFFSSSSVLAIFVLFFFSYIYGLCILNVFIWEMLCNVAYLCGLCHGMIGIIILVISCQMCLCFYLVRLSPNQTTFLQNI